MEDSADTPAFPVTLLTSLLALDLFPGLARAQATACGAKIDGHVINSDWNADGMKEGMKATNGPSSGSPLVSLHSRRSVGNADIVRPSFNLRARGTFLRF
jgi:hypothetical protein